jgi:hypothetical protein
MAKIADLLVNLTLESANFKSEIAASRREMKQFTSDIGDGFKSLASIVGVSIGAISASVAVDFVKNLAEGADQIGKLSQKIGISVEDLSTLQHSLKLSDVPMETFAKGAGLLSKALAGMADETEGGKGAGLALQTLGIRARDASGNLRPVVDVILDIADKFKGFEDGVGKTNLAMTLFGSKIGKELIPFLNQGAAAIRAAQGDAIAFGEQLTGSTAAAAEKFHDDLTRLEAVADGVSKQFLTGLLPSLNRLTEGFLEVSKASNTTEGSISQNIGRNTGELVESLTTKWLKFGYAVRDTKAWLDLQNVKFLEFIGLADKGEVAELAQELHNLEEGWKAVSGAMTHTASVSQQLFGSSGEFAKAIEALNKQFPVPKAQPPNLPDAAALAKAAAAAKKYAEDYKRAFEEIQKITDAGIISAASAIDAPFLRATQELRDNTVKITEDLAKFPELATKGPQRIGGIVAAAFRDYLAQLDKFGDKAKEEIDKILGDAEELSAHKFVLNFPIPDPKLPTLAGNDFYTNFIRGLTANKKNLQKELNDLLGVQQFKASIDQLILETGKASAGIGVFFRQYADYATNSAKVVHDAFAKVFSALEDQLTNLLAHFKFDIKSLLDTIKESIARAVVQKFILGPIAKALGLTKRDGSTKDNALYVEVTNGGGLFGGVGGSGGSSDSGDSGDGGDSSSGILGKIQGVMGKVFSAIGSFFKAIGSALVSAFKFIGGAIGGLFGGGKATGGDVFAGKFYLTGENGPELFAPGRSGTIIPNHIAFGGASHTSNVTQNFYLSPVRSDPFGYSQSQLAAATFTGYARATSRA